MFFALPRRGKDTTDVVNPAEVESRAGHTLMEAEIWRGVQGGVFFTSRRRLWEGLQHSCGRGSSYAVGNGAAACVRRSSRLYEEAHAVVQTVMAVGDDGGSCGCVVEVLHFWCCF